MFDSSLLPLDLYRVHVRCYVLVKTMFDSSLLPLDLYKVHVRCYVLVKTMFDSSLLPLDLYRVHVFVMLFAFFTHTSVQHDQMMFLSFNTSGAETAKHSGALEFTPGFLVEFVLLNLYFSV